jgi:hypothetical protein
VSRRSVLKVAIPLAMLLIFLLLLELFARAVFARPTMLLGIEMWKYAKDVKIRHQNPEIGHRHRPNAHDFLMGVDVRTNSFGLRDPERTFEKPADTTRIIMLGDSIVFGWGTAANETMAARLEKSLNEHPLTPVRKYEVWNTGVGNSNTAMEVTWFREEGWKFQPDCVLVGWFINDAEPTPVPSGNWFAYHSYAYVFFDSAFDKLLRRSKAKGNYRDYYESLYRDDQPGWPKCQRAFAEFAAFCAEKKIPAHILLIPELHTLGANYEFKKTHQMVREVCDRVHLPVLDLTDAFPTDGHPPDYWVCLDDDHPNGRGHGQMAIQIDESLRREGWVK